MLIQNVIDADVFADPCYTNTILYVQYMISSSPAGNIGFQYSWAILLCITPPTRYYHLCFFKLHQTFKNREGIVFQKNLAESLKF